VAVFWADSSVYDVAATTAEGEPTEMKKAQFVNTIIFWCLCVAGVCLGSTPEHVALVVVTFLAAMGNTGALLVDDLID
jgi:hypothetical protein